MITTTTLNYTPSPEVREAMNKDISKQIRRAFGPEIDSSLGIIFDDTVGEDAAPCPHALNLDVRVPFAHSAKELGAASLGHDSSGEPSRVYLCVRKSSLYRDAFAHLDKWLRLKAHAEILLTQQKWEDYDSGRRSHLVRVKQDEDTVTYRKENIIRALKDTFGPVSNCSHEHDCCGCVFGHVSDVETFNKFPDLYRITLSLGRNL